MVVRLGRGPVPSFALIGIVTMHPVLLPACRRTSWGSARLAWGAGGGQVLFCPAVLPDALGIYTGTHKSQKRYGFMHGDVFLSPKATGARAEDRR